MKLSKALKLATPGPLDILTCTGGDAIRLREGLIVFDRDSVDAKLFVHARNMLPELVKLCEAQRELLHQFDAPSSMASQYEGTMRMADYVLARAKEVPGV